MVTEVYKPRGPVYMQGREEGKPRLVRKRLFGESARNMHGALVEKVRSW